MLLPAGVGHRFLNGRQDFDNLQAEHAVGHRALTVSRAIDEMVRSQLQRLLQISFGIKMSPSRSTADDCDVPGLDRMDPAG